MIDCLLLVTIIILIILIIIGFILVEGAIDRLDYIEHSMDIVMEYTIDNEMRLRTERLHEEQAKKEKESKLNVKKNK